MDTIIENGASKVIILRGKDYDKRARTIFVTLETETDWYGYPTDNPRCPTLQWPKFAWAKD